MAREQHTRNPYRDQYHGEDYYQRYQQGRERDTRYDADEARMRDDRHWQQGPDERHSPNASRSRNDDGMYADGPSSRDRSETYRSRGNAEWEPYERESSRYRNGAANQADGYGQDMDRYQGNHRTVAPTHYDRGQNGSPNGPYNGQYADRQNEPGYGDTRGDRYGGGGFNGGRGYGARPSNGSYDQHRTDAPYYGAEFIQDMEKGRSDSRYAQREQDFDASWDSRDTNSSRSNFSGRGPKGWKRSDERIQEELSEQLERHAMIDASEIEVKVDGGEVTLSGTTTDRRTKRLAEDLADRVAGVREVQNQIRLQRADGQKARNGQDHQDGSSDRKSGADQSDGKQGKRSPMTS
ncbi:hypothetical protein GAU_3923 [Gemmatimonas aurantiaca T-27]|uniref:BON domain-containing protein n=2 Tax=Gemmatimonas aurantiaca TaxID=173480 RepID=C1AEN8_GEMAT|nr:BON domain-containing protein [Gemmatimonas aurantiaca]BAH40965.1 hypothetical protein GAU_3923 [Gemmatimonas aurantiaca T-27]